MLTTNNIVAGYTVLRKSSPATESFPLFSGKRNEVVFFLRVFFTMVLILVGSAAEAKANLISNPDFEVVGANGDPANWTRGRWGTNAAVFEYPVTGISASRAARVRLTSRTTGDAKWVFNNVPVTSGKEYEFSDFYNSTVTNVVTVEFLMTNGTRTYVDLGSLPAQTNFTKATFRFTVPTGVQSLTVFHLINAVGSLTVDGYSLDETAAPPADPNNLISNPSLETVGTNGLPRDWFQGGKWGTNTSSYSYPVTGFDGARAARVDVTSYTSGDAKWYFKEISATPGQTYQFSDFTKSNVTTFVTAQIRLTNGSLQYLDLGSIGPSATTWHQFTKTFTAPANAASLTIFHLIKSVGRLEVDKYSLTKVASTDPTKFLNGFVTLSFDDGRRSSYDTALPILDRAGLKSSHYIVTSRMGAGFPGFIKGNEVLDIQARGHEVGSHTRTHADLTTLTSSQLTSEVSGSRQDLINLGISQVVTFAYPFGAFNSTVIQAVKNAGYTGARTTNSGNNLKTENAYALRRESLKNTTTLTQVKGWIDKAVAEKTWLILALHDVNTSGEEFSITPDLFQAIVDYLKSKNVEVKTLKDGVARLAS